MAKMRVNELAKKIGISNKELITLLNDNGIASVTSHANNISEDAASAAIKLYNSSKTEKTEQRSKPTDAADNNKVNTIPDIKNASEAPKAREAKEEARVVNTTVVHDGGAKRGEADSSSKSGRDNSGQPPKKKIVMKINPQNISSKGNAKKLARKDGKPEQGRRNDGRQENKRVLSENDRRRQEILERQRKIEEFKRQQEAEELRLQQEIEMKRQQIREAKNEAGSGLEGRTLESLQPESTAYAGRGRSGGEAASVAAKAPQTGSQQIRATASDNEAVKNSGNDASANTEKTNKSQAIIGANSTQVMESKKDKHQTGKPSKTQGRDSYGRTNEARGADSRQGASREGRGNSSGNNGNSSDRQGNRRDFRAGERTGGSGGFAAKRPFQREGGREASSENTDRKNYQDKDRRQFKPRDNQGFRSNSMPRFDKDKDEQDSKNVRREKPRNDKSHSGAATAAIDDRNKKAKDKIRESKESKSKDKRKDKNERFEKSFSLERTSKKTHKQDL